MTWDLLISLVVGFQYVILQIKTKSKKPIQLSAIWVIEDQKAHSTPLLDGLFAYISFSK